ncbi:MAG: hypothetical protein KatS3mg032_0263 [Cyclobacteriaceae bacterium]|nr:MAG: hypothetical protein KatS3mg032_0263 [Cyclobacteriaceae bacterium]
MKNLRFIYGLVLVALTVACTQEKKNDDAAEWPEMDAFHLIMAESYHPFRDSANLEPARRLAPEMAAAATKWAGATLPEKVNTPEVKEKINLLKSATDEFAQLVQTGSEEEIGNALTGLHDLFHELQDAWYGKGGGGHDHHKH